MIFVPISGKLTPSVSNTVVNLGDAAASTPGYNFWGYEIDNTAGAATVYLQLFDVPASEVVLGTTAAKLVYAVQAGVARGFGFGPHIPFARGLSGAVTSAPHTNGAPGSPCDVTIYHEAL